MTQFLRPDSNVTQTNWTNGFANIDEAVASDADFAYGANNSSTATLEVGLSNPPLTPADTGTCTVRWRYAKVSSGTLSGTGGTVTQTCGIYQGATLITSSTVTTSGAWTAGSFTFNASSITDATDLRLRFTQSASGGGGNARGSAVSWAEVEVPDPALDAGVGAFTLAGTTTGLLFNRRLDKTTATFTLSGTNTGLNINLQLNLTTVGFTLAGTNTGLLFNSRLDGSTATFALAGTNTGILFNRQLDQTAASFVLSGTNADLRYDRSLLTTVGTFTLAGTNTDLLANRQLDLTTEGFTLVGVTTELQRLLLLNQLTGSFVLTGNNADLDYFPIGGGGFTLDCLLGTYTVSGTLLELNKAKIFTLVSKDFSVFFLPAELRREFTLNTNAGSFNINTFNLAYFASRTLNAQRAAFSVYVQDGGSNIFRYVPLSQPVVFTPIPKGRNQWILGKFTSGGKGSFRV